MNGYAWQMGATILHGSKKAGRYSLTYTLSDHIHSSHQLIYACLIKYVHVHISSTLHTFTA
eukprot:scaffold568_cov93-Skeletonema_marinoi.AAC.2